MVPPAIAAKALDCGFTRESMYSRHNGMICPKPSSSVRLSFAAHTRPLWIELSRTVIRSSECVSVNCFQILVLEKIPEVLLLVISRLSKHHWSRYFFLVNLSTSCYLQINWLALFFLVKPNCSHQFVTVRKCWADLQNEWFGIRSLCSKYPGWSARCLCRPSCTEFHDSKHLDSWILDDLYLRIVPPSDWLWNPIFLPPYHFFSSPGPRNVQCPCKNIFA